MKKRPGMIHFFKNVQNNIYKIINYDANIVPNIVWQFSNQYDLS